MLRIAVTVAVILLVIGIIVVVVKVLNPKADTQKGLQKLKQMEQTDVAKVDKKIQKLEEAERQADEEWASVRQARSLPMRSYWGIPSRRGCLNSESWTRLMCRLTAEPG